MESVASLQSQDADPLPPCGQPNERGAGDQAGPEVVLGPQNVGLTESSNISMPDENWRFNTFLDELADEIDDKELGKLKRMFIDSIGRGVLEKIKNASDLFDHLRKLTRLSKDNLVCLQAILMRLKRPELIEMAVDYARTVGDVIFFYPAAEPVNGYRSIKVHVDGKDFKNCTPDYIRDVRAKLSHWLFIPLEHVLMAGVEPSSSMLITFKIPDLYADVLEKMLLDQKDTLHQLSELEIDTIQIGDKTFNIRGIQEAEIVETEQQRKLVSVYQQLQDKTKELDSMEHEVIDLQEDHRTLEKKFDDLEMETVTLRNMFIRSENDNQVRPASLASQAALVKFKESLDEIKENNYDREVISHLLDAHSVVVVNRSRESYVIQLQQLNLQVQELQSQLMPLQLELVFRRTNDAGILETVLKDSLQKLLQAINVPTQNVVQTLTDYGYDILKKMSRCLRDRERRKLEKKYTWDPNDSLTKCKNTDQSLFLSCIFYKETERTGGFVDFGTFVQECLKDVNRPDLQKKFQDMMTKSERQSRPRQRTPSSHGSQGDTAPAKSSDDQLAKIGEEVHTVMEKVNSIEQSITSAMNYRQPFDQPFASKPIPTGSYGVHFEPSGLRLNRDN